MTSQREQCAAMEEIEVLLRLPPGDPRRRHLDTCPRCRARVITFLEFVAPPNDLPADLLRHADSTLEDALRRELARGAERRPAGAERPARAWLRFAPPRPVGWAFAVIALLVVVASVRFFAGHRETEPVLLRDSGARDAAASVPSELRAVADGERIELSWDPVPGADAYEVRVYGLDLTEIARIRATVDARAQLTRASLPSSMPPRTSALWRVVALREGDPFGESPPAALLLP
jgi:hypothetical protein